MDFSKLTPSVGPFRNSEPASGATPGKRLTVLLGSGASRHAGAPSTEELTRCIAALPVCERVLNILQSRAGTVKANFEDVLHVLEELEVLSDPVPPRAAAALQPFLELRPLNERLLGDPLFLRSQRLDAIDAIGDAFAKIDYDTTWRPLYSALRPFLDDYNLDIFTLNYDLVGDVAVNALAALSGRKFFDGFGGIIDMDRNEKFNPDLYANPPWDLDITIAHLHGCVAFSYARANPNMAYAEQIDIVQAATDTDAKLTWQKFHKAARSDLAFSLDKKAPIVSGLNKLEKLNVRPYSDYYNHFGRAVSASPYILVIGYGVGDEHINYWFREAALIHTNKLRVVEITNQTDSSRFISQRLAAYNLNWRQVAHNLYQSDAGAHYLVCASGLSVESQLPSDVFRSFLNG